MKVIEDWWEHRHDKFWEGWDYSHRWNQLATYNSEVARGIMHTQDWDKFMAEEQRLFDEEQSGPDRE